MKKEDLQNSQQGTGSAEDNGESGNAQKNQAKNISNSQNTDMSREAGLGSNRITDVEEMGGLSGRNDFAGGDRDDLSNEDLNAANDQ